jgi:hypothetical protein
VARRLWAGTNFIGALPDTLVRIRNEIDREEFKDLEQRGPFKLPRTISHSGWPGGRLRTYFVKKIEFRPEPTSKWYVRERNRLFREAPEKEREFQTGKTNWLSVH